MNLAMIGNYFKISYRHMVKYRTFAAINILGLALGMAAALLTYEYAAYENSFDDFHTNSKNIYRVTTEWNADITSDDKRATTVPWSGPGIKEEFPEVIEYARFASINQFTGYNAVSYNDKHIVEQEIFLADPGFLKIFSYPLLKGDRETALNDPTSVVITESIAKKYFKDQDPIGKLLSINTHGNLTENTFKVTGVIKDPPANSHLAFDFLISFNVMMKVLSNGSTYWHWDYTYCYLLLRPVADIKALEKKISDLRVKKFGAEMNYYKDRIDFKLQPLKDIHLYSSLKGELLINGDGRSLSFLIVVGICIILSAYINYINLSTLKAVERRTEIGIRKVVGSSKRQLMAQLLIESLLLNVMALAIALLIFRLSVPLIEEVFNIQWPDWGMSFITWRFLLFTILIIFLGIVLSAAYPAFILTSFKPAEVLKGKSTMLPADHRWNLRKSLIVIQFIFCITFTIGTYSLYKQLQFMKSHDLGMNMEQVVAVKGYGFDSYNIYEKFKQEVLALAFVQSVGASSAAPGDEIIELSLKPKVALAVKPSQTKEVKLVTVDEDYFSTLGIKFLAGRNFEKSNDNRSVVINEAALKLLGYTNPEKIMNETLKGLYQEDPKIIGVIKNYNQRSLKSDFEPMIFVPNWIRENDFGWNKRYFFVRMNPAHTLEEHKDHLHKIEIAWKNANDEKPFQYFFMDEHFDSQYKADTAFSSLFLFFSGFAIFISCLGLFGLVAYTTFQRTKEIGVRKVLGASVENILMLLSKDFVGLVLIAVFLSIPLIIAGLQYWLNYYAFRIELSIWLFLVPLAVILFVAFLTIVVKSMKVATTNPVDSLRYE